MSFNLEPLFTGIDIIVEKRLENIAFDKTIICEIRNAENSKDGEYQVSDGSVVFAAYSDNTKYRVGDSVRVTIPQGDYTQKKYIVGKSVTENNISPISYLSPLDSVVNIDSSLIETQFGITANGSDSEITIWGTSLVEDANFASIQNKGIYDTITLKASFRTLFNNYDIYSGEYGLRLDVYTKYGENALVKNSAFLSSKDMFGNPYSFSIYSEQAITFDITNFESIQAVTLTLYQNNDFTDRNVGKINPSMANDILVKNIEIGFGSDIVKIADNTLKIYSLDDPGYKYYGYTESTNLKRIGLQWYNKDDNNKYVGFSDGIYDPNYDEIEYLNAVSADTRLLAQKGKANIPTDEESLNHSANIEETSEWTIKARNLITQDLYQTLANFSLQIAGVPDAKNSIDNYKNTLSVTADNINTALDNIKEIYNIVLTYGYQKQKGDNPEWTTISDDSFVNLKDLFNSIPTDIDNLLDTVKDQLVSGYLSIYDNYVIRLNNFKTTLKNYVDKIPAIKEGEFDSLNNYQTKTIYEEYSSNIDTTEYDNKYCIYWYRQNKESDGDSFMPKGWVKIDFNKRNIGLPLKEVDGYYAHKANNSNGVIKYSMQPDLDEEKFVAVLFYNHQMIKSNELVFTNLDEIPKKSTLNDSDVLSFEHVENGHSYDSYYVYNLNNYLNDIADASHQRQIRCHYEGAAASDEVFAEAGIYWYIPINSTMLLAGDNLTSVKGFSKDEAYPKAGYDCYYKKMIYDNNNNSFGEIDTRDFWYKIKEYYEPTINNSIICEVRLNGQEDPIFSSITFSFGVEGTSGTRYTMEITNATSQVATLPDSDLILNVALRDRDRNKVKMSAAPGMQTGYVATGFNVEWAAGGGGAIGLPAADVDFITIPKDTYGIIEVSASLYDQGIKLSTLYPIAWSGKIEAYLSGPTSIVYNSFGTLDNYSMYSKPYELYDRNTNKKIDNITWEMDYLNNDSSLYMYLPTLNKDNTLTPSSLYLDGLNCYPVIVAKQGTTVVWRQPIVIFQNRYSSTMLNDWDGSFQVNEKNGTILGTMFGAGRKNTDNTFSGVLMGDVATTADATVGEMGIYGYHHGGQSFGFKIDGTAFLGKAGAGRIHFDGNKGTISSPGWAQNGKKWECQHDTGTMLDLDDAQLLLKGKNGYLYFNDNGDGALKMSLSGANIQLSDKNNTGLSGYIDATAAGIVTEIRRSANYYGTSTTDSSDSTKVVTLLNGSIGNDVSVDGNSALSINDILKNGVTIAVTFTNEEKLIETKTNTTNKDDDGKDIVVGTKVTYKGRQLSLAVNGSESKVVYFNNAPTSENNYFNWVAGATVYFIYDDELNDKKGGWLITDSGSYSRVIQTADMIRNEVSDIGGNLSASITLTAKNIRSEVNTVEGNLNTSITQTAAEIISEARRNVAYYGISNSTGAEKVVGNLTIKNSDGNHIKAVSDDELFQTGITVAITFTAEEKVTITGGNDAKNYTRTGRALSLKIREKSRPIYYNGFATSTTNAFGWAANTTVYFIYNGNKDSGYWQIGDSGSYSNITQTADMIKSEVTGIRGYASSIEQKADSIQSEVRHTASYYGTAQSDSGNSAIKVFTLLNTPSDFNSSNDLYQNGIIIALTIKDKEELSTSSKVVDNKTTYTTTGRKLYLRYGNVDSAKQIYLNNESVGEKNPFGWEKDTTIYFIYDISVDGWRVGDSGSYSKIIQTADSIRSEVATADGANRTLIDQNANSIKTLAENDKNLGSLIEQNAEAIKHTVRQTADYYATQVPNPALEELNEEMIKFFDLNDDSKEFKVEDGIILSLTFKEEEDSSKYKNENNQTGRALELIKNGDFSSRKIYFNGKSTGPGNPFGWVKDQTIYFMYNEKLENGNGAWEVIDFGAYSQMVQTLDAISAKVSSKGGTDGFGWKLTDSGFTLQSTVGNSETDVFVCNKGGITISGNASFTGYVNATSGYIGNWKLTSTSLTNGGSTYDPSIGFYTSFSDDYPTTVAGKYSSNWRIIVGNNFGVDRDGNLYCSGGTFSGNIGSSSSRASDIYGTYINGYRISSSYLATQNLNIGSTDYDGVGTGTFKYNGEIVIFQNVTIGGVSYALLGIRGSY